MKLVSLIVPAEVFQPPFPSSLDSFIDVSLGNRQQWILPRSVVKEWIFDPAPADAWVLEERLLSEMGMDLDSIHYVQRQAAKGLKMWAVPRMWIEESKKTCRAHGIKLIAISVEEGPVLYQTGMAPATIRRMVGIGFLCLLALWQLGRTHHATLEKELAQFRQPSIPGFANPLSQKAVGPTTSYPLNAFLSTWIQLSRQIPKGVWLQSLKLNGNKLETEGMSQGNNAASVFAWVHQLEKINEIHAVNLESLAQPETEQTALATRFKIRMTL